MKSLSEILLEKLKVTKNASSVDTDESTMEVPYYEFVIWYTGALDKKPNQVQLDDFELSDFASSITDSYGNEVFVDAKSAYDFYKIRKNDIITITIEQMRGPAGDNGAFLNTIDCGDIIFYAESYEDFRDYKEYVL